MIENPSQYSQGTGFPRNIFDYRGLNKVGSDDGGRTGKASFRTRLDYDGDVPFSLIFEATAYRDEATRRRRRARREFAELVEYLENRIRVGFAVVGTTSITTDGLDDEVASALPAEATDSGITFEISLSQEGTSKLDVVPERQFGDEVEAELRKRGPASVLD